MVSIKNVVAASVAITCLVCSIALADVRPPGLGVPEIGASALGPVFTVLIGGMLLLGGSHFKKRK